MKTVKAVNAAKRLIKYCHKHKCANCIFCVRISSEYPICALNHPYSWQEIKGVEHEHFSN